MLSFSNEVDSFFFSATHIYFSNTINISKILVQHSRTKHIGIRHHFIRELVEDGTLNFEFIHIDDQKADLFTKPLDSKLFEFLRQNIGVISMEISLLFLLISHAFASSFMICVSLYIFVFYFSFFCFICFS